MLILYLNILSPANYKEFARVLKHDGVIMKVIPCSNYLIELRALAKEQLKNEKYSNHQTKDYFMQHVDLLKQEKVHCNLCTNEEQAKEFANMTPMLEHINKNTIELETVNSITIELEILIGKLKNTSVNQNQQFISF